MTIADTIKNSFNNVVNAHESAMLYSNLKIVDDATQETFFLFDDDSVLYITPTSMETVSE